MGNNNLGQLGIPSLTEAKVATEVEIKGAAIQISADHYRSMVLLSDGSVQIFGYQTEVEPQECPVVEHEIIIEYVEVEVPVNSTDELEPLLISS